MAALLLDMACSDDSLHGLPVCDPGAITGRICAPDQRTWVNGASVSVNGYDCAGRPVDITTTSASNGSFVLDGIPEGQWVVHVELGAFSKDTPVDVTAGQTTAVPDDGLCVAQEETRIAVVTGAGDKIEDLLTALGLTFTRYLGDTSHFASDGAQFLADLDQMKQYDLIFVDCAAGKAYDNTIGNKIDLGPDAPQIEQNLHDYVVQGGSLYASDWALLFAVYAEPGSLDFLLNGGGTVANPLATDKLMGYAPQTVAATVEDPDLSAFLGKTQVSIVFPKESGAVSLHWGLLQDIGADVSVLMSAATVQACETAHTDCSSAGATMAHIPLAVSVKLTPAGSRGGHVTYTSFHNVGQTGDDVAQVLKYIVLHL